MQAFGCLLSFARRMHGATGRWTLFVAVKHKIALKHFVIVSTCVNLTRHAAHVIAG